MSIVSDGIVGKAYLAFQSAGKPHDTLRLAMREALEAVSDDLVMAEREACAKIFESINNHDNPMTAQDCADVIRARSQKTKGQK